MSAPPSDADLPLSTLIAEPWRDYGLVDSGHGRKLERYGRFRFIRPEPQALWAPAQPQWSARRIGDIRLLLWTAQRQRFVVAGNARTHGLMRAADAMTMR